jgi:hypothetical protein
MNKNNNNKIREQIVNELHKPAQKKFLRKPVKILGIDDLWQADLTILDAFSKVNSGYKYLLVVIDCFSKFAWVKKLKTKSGLEVAREFRAIFNETGRSCINLQVDKGTEFYNPYFKNVMREFNVNLYSTYTHIKASIVERLQRTLKEKLWKKFTLNGNYTGPYFPIGTLGTCLGRKDFRGDKFLKLTLHILSSTRVNVKSNFRLD